MCVCSQMTSALQAFQFYIQFSIYSWRAKSWKILLQRDIFLSQALQKQGERGLPRMCCTTVCLPSFVLETDLLGEVRMDVFLSLFVTNLPRVSGLVFRSSCPEIKLRINAAMMLAALQKKNLKEFRKKKKKKRGEMNICWIHRAI